MKLYAKLFPYFKKTKRLKKTKLTEIDSNRKINYICIEKS